MHAHARKFTVVGQVSLRSIAMLLNGSDDLERWQVGDIRTETAQFGNGLLGVPSLNRNQRFSHRSSIHEEPAAPKCVDLSVHEKDAVRRGMGHEAARLLK